MITQQGFTPSFIIEAQSSAHTQNMIDNFVEKISRGLRYDLGFLYSSRCKNVGLPVTEPKGKYLELEIADLIAFMAARFFHQEAISKPFDLPLERLGEIHWGMFLPGGYLTRPSIGFPTDYYKEAAIAVASGRTPTLYKSNTSN